MERGEMLVVVVRRRPGPYTLEREGGGGDVAGSRHWCREMEGGGGDEVARTLRARAGGGWWWWPGSLLSAPQPPPLSSLPSRSIPGPLPPSRSLIPLSLPCLPGRALSCSPPAHSPASRSPCCPLVLSFLPPLPALSCPSSSCRSHAYSTAFTSRSLVRVRTRSVGGKYQ